MSRKVLTPQEIAHIGIERHEKARAELYKILIKTIKDFKKKKQPNCFLSDNDINNVLATLIKNSTDVN